MVKDKVAEAELKYLDVNEHSQQMKNIMMEETTQVSCGLLKSPCRHNELLLLLLLLHSFIHLMAFFPGKPGLSGTTKAELLW